VGGGENDTPGLGAALAVLLTLALAVPASGARLDAYSVKLRGARQLRILKEQGFDVTEGQRRPLDRDRGNSGSDSKASNVELLVDDPRTSALRGSRGDDVIRGTPGDDLIVCGSGDDVIRRGPGDDRVFSGSGNDHVSGRSGRDRLRGGRDLLVRRARARPPRRRPRPRPASSLSPR
jgi:Ca2+-binding RTX toxin-like protein